MATKTKNLTVEHKKGEELITRTDIKDSPFMVVSIPEKNHHFGVLGKFRITEFYDDKQLCVNELSKVTWNRIVQVFSLLMDTYHENENKTTKTK